MKSLLAAAALASVFVATASAQLVHTNSSGVGTGWRIAQQHLSTSAVTPVTSPAGMSALAADDTAGVLYLIGPNGVNSNYALHAWSYGAPAPVLVGDLVINGATYSGTFPIDMAFAAGKLYFTSAAAFGGGPIYEIDSATAAGSVWYQSNDIDPAGIAYDPDLDRLIVRTENSCAPFTCGNPAAIYALNRTTQALSFVASLPPVGAVSAITVGGGKLWGTGAAALAVLDLATSTWDPTPPANAHTQFFFGYPWGIAWAPGFTSGCAGVVYCTAGTSTQGCVPTICASGVPSGSSASGFDISITGLDGQRAGLILYGIAGPLAAPWSATSTSYRCVQNPVQRMGAQNSGGTAGACDGVLSEDWNAYLSTHPSALGQPYSGGETVWASGWYRDPAASKSSSLSNGIEFYVQP